MTLEREVYGKRRTQVRLVACPFCEADLERRRGSVPEHLEDCEAFAQAWGYDSREN